MRAVLCLLMVAACSSRVITPDASAADASAADALTRDVASADAASDAPGPSDGAVRCGQGVASFPSFDARCAGDEDCTLGVHQTDCCGNTVALGMRTSERAGFEAAEAICRPMYPACGCPSLGTLADDGARSHDVGALRVACRAGRCTTSVAQAAACPGVTCGAGQLCARGCCGVPGCTPPPARCVTVPPACGGRPSCECLGRGACPSGSCVSVERTEVVCLCA